MREDIYMLSVSITAQNHQEEKNENINVTGHTPFNVWYEYRKHGLYESFIWTICQSQHDTEFE